MLTGVRRQQFRESRGDETGLAVTFQRLAVEVEQQVAFLALAGKLRRVVEHQHRCIGWRAQGAVEHAVQGFAVAPDGGGEIQWVDQVSVAGQHLCQFADLPGIELGQAQVVAFGVVGDQASIATRAG
ncbi:hypothetical protein D3C76_1179860 [compost metagenome]